MLFDTHSLAPAKFWEQETLVGDWANPDRGLVSSWLLATGAQCLSPAEATSTSTLPSFQGVGTSWPLIEIKNLASTAH